MEIESEKNEERAKLAAEFGQLNSQIQVSFTTRSCHDESKAQAVGTHASISYLLVINRWISPSGLKFALKFIIYMGLRSAGSGVRGEESLTGHKHLPRGHDGQVNTSTASFMQT